MNDVLLKKDCHVYNIIFTKIEKHFIGIEKTLFIFLKSILKKNMCKYTKNIIIIYIYIYKYNFLNLPLNFSPSTNIRLQEKI